MGDAVIREIFAYFPHHCEVCHSIKWLVPMLLRFEYNYASERYNYLCFDPFCQTVGFRFIGDESGWR